MKYHFITILSFLSIIASVIIPFIIPDIINDYFWDVLAATFSILVIGLFVCSTIRVYMKRKIKGTIYLAYNFQTTSIADYFREHLTKLGYRCYPSPNLANPGDNWKSTGISKELSDSSAVIVFIYDDDAKSNYIQHTIRNSRKQDISILPIKENNNTQVPSEIKNIFPITLDVGKDIALRNTVFVLKDIIQNN